LRAQTYFLIQKGAVRYGKKNMASLTTVIRLTKSEQETPGPGQYAVPPQFGKEGIHASMAGRRDAPQKIEGAPLQALPSSIGEGPKYTFHGRPQEKDRAPTPGPNYVPPRFGAEGPTSAFHGYVKQPKSNDGPGVPGPGQYPIATTIGAGKNRAWTVKARNFVVEEGSPAGPGPGKYMPTFKAVEPDKHVFQYRPRVEPKSHGEDTPGPGQYPIKRNLAEGAMAFHGYMAEPKSTLNVPGPKYDVPSSIGKDVPSYSIRQKCEPPTQHLTKAPYQAIPSTIGETQKWSFQGRPLERVREPTPGPNYMPPAFGKEGPGSSFHGKIGPNKKKGAQVDPGPGEYPITGEIGRGKKWTMKARQFPPGENGKPDGPGPGKYLPNEQNRPGHRSIHGKIPEPKDKEKRPQYVNIGSTMGDGPKWTIGRKETLALGPGLE
jgi:hypothetical protein